MGILGLLQYVRACLKQRRLSDYRGKTAAVDSYAWLHKIIKGPSGRELILGGPNKNKFVSDCLKRISKIENLGIKVIMVFDGGPLPGKKQEEQVRRKRRQQTFVKGKEMLEQGDQAGFKKLVDSIDITPDIAYRLIVQLKKRGTAFIVAPYEADAQLAYLSRTGIADFIITEDSDLMPFGAKLILYKLDFATMSGCELQTDQIPSNREVNFTWFTHCMFLTTCILSGCDYLNQIAGIGIKTAQKSIGRVTTFRGFLGQVANKSLIPSQYQSSFMKAFLTFRFQRVYCPIRKACVQLNDFSALQQSAEFLLQKTDNQIKWTEQVMNLEVMQYTQMNQLNFAFLGQKYDDNLARGIAQGNIHPTTFIQYDVNIPQTLTYVPTVPLRINSTLNCARKIQTKTQRIKKKQQNDNKNQSFTLFKFLKQGSIKQSQKFDPSIYEFKSVKEGEQLYLQSQPQLNKNNEEDSQKYLQEFKPIKGRLRLTEDDGEQSDQENSVVVSYLDSDSVEEIPKIDEHKSEVQSIKSCKNSLQQMAEKLFGQIFTQEYFRHPFSS